MAAISSDTMDARWFYANGKQKVGPFSFAQLHELACTGQIIPVTMILQEGARKWHEAATLPGLFFDSTTTNDKIPVARLADSSGQGQKVPIRQSSQIPDAQPAAPRSAAKLRYRVIAIASGLVSVGLIVLGVHALLQLYSARSTNSAGNEIDAVAPISPKQPPAVTSAPPVTTVPAVTTAPVLRYKFKADETWLYVMRQKIEVTMTGSGTTNTMETSLQMATKWKVLNVQVDDKAKMGLTVNRIVFTIVLPQMGMVTYDSAAEKEPDGDLGKSMAWISKGMMGSDFTFTMNSLGECSDVHLPETLLEALLHEKARGVALMFSTDSLKAIISQGGIVLSTSPVMEGDSWTRRTNTKNVLGTTHFVYNMTYKGSNAKQEVKKIGIVATLKFDSDPSAPVKMKLLESEAKGEAFFDNEAGRFIQVSLEQTMKMQSSTGGQDITSTSKQESTRRLGAALEGR